MLAVKTAILYARVSSREQEKEGYSIPAQQKAICGYAIEEGYEVVGKFIDVESAGKTGRKEFGRMVQFIENNEDVSAIICH